MDFYVTEEGKHKTIHSFDDCVESLSYLHKEQEHTIKRLNKQVKDLKEEHFKDTKLAEMQKRLDEMKEDYLRGFPLSKDEETAISKWKDNHIRRKHWDVKNKCPKYTGAIGGTFSYQFTPTGIGVIGEIRCSCGECFCFRDL